MTDELARSEELGLGLLQRKRVLRAARCLHAGCWPLEPCPEMAACRCGAWGRAEVEAWLLAIGMERHCAAFEQHRLAGWVLAELTDADLREIGVEAVGGAHPLPALMFRPLPFLLLVDMKCSGG